MAVLPLGPSNRNVAATDGPGPRWSERAPGLVPERGGELERLNQAVTALLFGRSGGMVVTGRRGAGVSTLLRAAVTHAQEIGLAAALARCSPAEAGLRHGLVSQLAAGLGAAGFPLHALRAGVDPATSPDVPGLCAEFVAVARAAPLVLAVDDPQWADEESWNWLSAMAHRLHQAPILLLTGGPPGAARPGGPQPIPWTVVELPPLGPRGVGEMITSRYRGPVAPSFVEGAATFTDGNPAVLQRVLDRFADEDVTPSPESLPMLREYAADASAVLLVEMLDALPPDALVLFRAMAACGGNLDAGLVATLAGPAATPVTASMESLVRAGLVTPGPEPRPVDQRAAAAALAGMPPAERRALSAKAAELAHRAAVPHERQAELLLDAPPLGHPWVLEVLRATATRYRVLGEYTRAAALLVRALREPAGLDERCRLLIDLAMTEAVTSPDSADRRLQRVVLGMEPGVREQTVVAAADLLQLQGDLASAGAIATAVERAGGKPGPLAALGLVAESHRAWEPALPAPGLPDLPDDPGGPVEAGAMAWLMAIRGRDRDRVRRLARIALAPGESRAFSPRLHACRALLCADEFGEAVAGLDDLLQDARERGAAAVAALALAERGWSELRRGRLPQAADDLDQARAELPVERWRPSALARMAAFEAALYLAKGEVNQAEPVLEAPSPAGAERSSGLAYLQYMRGRLALVVADPQAAQRHFREAGRSLLAMGWANPALLPWRAAAATAHYALGDHATAARYSRASLEQAHVWGAPTAIGEAHLWAARVTEGPAVVRHLEDAVTALRKSPARPPLATALIELSGLKAGAGAPVEASKLAEEAAGTATSPVEPPLGARAQNLVGRLAADRPRAQPTLSEEANRIAALAAGGRSNAEIARLLGISVRTVELRLTGVYRTLGIKGREQLTDLMRSLGVED